MDDNDWVHEKCGGEISGQEYDSIGWLWTCDICEEEWDSPDYFNQIRRKDFQTTKAEMENEIADLNGRIYELTQERVRLTEQIQEANSTITRLRKALNDIQHRSNGE